LNYSYIYLNRCLGQDRIDLFKQLDKSVKVLKDIEKDHGSIHVFSDINDQEIKTFSREQGLLNRPISISRCYSSNGSLSLIDILAEKIIQLRDFDQDQETVLLDVDTVFLKKIDRSYWDDSAVFWKAEYQIQQFRNLDRVLPQIPWSEIDIKFDHSFMMYNTGVVYIPKKYRKEVCEKALWITDYLNNGRFSPEDRYGNKLDEQIGLSIAVHDVFGRQGKIKCCDQYIHHYWEEKTKGIRWWE
jgi:hypothetical protein